jgi:Ca2+-binding EF-hand superfamily protein
MASAKPARSSGPPSTASNEEVEEMREVFACFDKDSSGAVTTAELALVLKSMNKNYTEAELKKIISKFDVNGQLQTRTIADDIDSGARMRRIRAVHARH